MVPAVSDGNTYGNKRVSKLVLGNERGRPRRTSLSRQTFKEQRLRPDTPSQVRRTRGCNAAVVERYFHVNN